MTIKTKSTAPTAPAAPVAKSPSKSVLVLKLLGRAKGATIAEIEAPTGWQPCSTRAYLSGLRKKGRSIVREQRKTGETAYRIVDAASPAVAGSEAEIPFADATAASHDSKEACCSVSDGTGDDARAVGSANADAGAVAASNTASA